MSGNESNWRSWVKKAPGWEEGTTSVPDSSIREAPHPNR